MVHPAAHGLIRDQDPTLGQQIPDVTEAQGEPDIKPDRLLDDFGREAVAAIAALGHHQWLRLKVTDGKPNGDVTMPWNRFACRAGASWRVDETYVKIKVRWTYLYRAVDKQGILRAACLINCTVETEPRPNVAE